MTSGRPWITRAQVTPVYEKHVATVHAAYEKARASVKLAVVPHLDRAIDDALGRMEIADLILEQEALERQLEVTQEKLRKRLGSTSPVESSKLKTSRIVRTIQNFLENGQPPVQAVHNACYSSVATEALRILRRDYGLGKYLDASLPAPENEVTLTLEEMYRSSTKEEMLEKVKPDLMEANRAYLTLKPPTPGRAVDDKPN